MKLEELQGFCHVIRSGLTSPWSGNGFTYASDGAVGIRVPFNPEATRTDGPDLEVLIQNADRGSLIALETLSAKETEDCPTCDGTGKAQKCPHCDGEGEVSFDCDTAKCFHNYEVTCHECDGSGKTSVAENGGEDCDACDGSGQREKETDVHIGVRKFHASNLRKIEKLPGVVIQPNGNPFAAAYFKFDGGDGLIIPTR
jgi:DnaJ-class molecular chaperone